MIGVQFELPDEFLETHARRVAEIVAELLDARPASTPWLSVAEAARYLGLTEQAIRTLLKRGAIPAHRPNGRVFLDRAELDVWVRGDHVPYPRTTTPGGTT